MTYQRALAFLASQQFQSSRGRDYYQKIERVNRFFLHCDNPHKNFELVLVGGTVGKTSTCYYLARLLQSSKCKVGLHISPHLQSPRERIQINEKYISKVNFSKLLSEYQPLIQEINLSYAETLFVLAIIYFRRQLVDWAVVEVGLGGLYDPTNSLDPIISVITNIGNDHGELLGKSNLAKLKEKFAIGRPGRTLITGVTQPDLKNWIINQAKLQNTRVIFIQPNDDYQRNDLSIAQAVVKRLATRSRPALRTQSKVGPLVTTLQIPGRLEWLSNRLLIDCAHNKPGLRALKKYLLTNQIDCEFVTAKPGGDEKDSAKFVDHVMNRLKYSHQIICATGSIFAVGALRDHWYPIE